MVSALMQTCTLIPARATRRGSDGDSRRIESSPKDRLIPFLRLVQLRREVFRNPVIEAMKILLKTAL